ncbi:hypothetical protein GSI_13115 [Ganoderma sinense ZZ0214-1]|uniref:Uncharacterized protein n=1 Tax=Ganoderma sinense ZZ0214-1 TaxID=1077348 RepID=A0A2G8RUN2_9APHY|nr:hypothetical protein GSI_13115 [Ganoderma sinense ZZ0214-1]
MPTQCNIARPANRVYHEPIDTAQRNMAHQTPSYRPAPTQSNQSPSRRVPADFTSQSLPQSLWLSDVAEFSTSPPSLSRPFPGFGQSLRAGSISSGSLSDSGQSSSRPLQRPPSRDYLLSASPSRSVTLSISGSHPRHHTPSPVPSFHTLHSSRSFGAVSPHRNSVSSVHAGGHLDLKRLMSKPAMQTSTTSTSLMHDSERSLGGPSSSRVDHSRYLTDGAISRPPPSRSAHASRERPPLNVNTVGSRSSSAPRHGYTSSPERKEPSGDSQTGRASRNVLRRRPSARSNPSTPTVSNFRPATEQTFSPPARSASIKQPDSGIPFISSPIPLVTSPNTRDLQAPTPPRTKTISSPSIPHVPAGLTPAGAVALAYKQQEQRREELAETASFNEAYQPSSINMVKPAHPERQASSGAESGEGTGRPYYTVFGGESGRLVAVGGPEDDWHYRLESRASMSPNAKPSPSPGARSLTRKVSGSLKKVAGSIKRGEREQRELPASSGDEWKPYDGSKPAPTRDPSTSSQSRLVSRTPSKASLKPINLDTAPDGKREFSPSAKLSPAAKSSPSPREGSRPFPLSKAGKGRAHEHEEDAASSKWWKLMKRISTGGLREKYTASDAPPPVPALPANLKTVPVGRKTMDISSGRGNGEEVNENGVLLQRFMRSRSSLSGVRPSLSPSSKTPPSGGSPRTSTANGSSARSPAAAAIKGRASTSGHRPSIATRSSSPGSSDMATSSMSNHNPTSSTRSSFSSYGEEIPPVPKPVGQYIISPSELSLMTKSSENVRSASLPAQQRPHLRTRSRSQTAPSEDPSFEIVHSSFEDSRFPSLPLPPRRATTGATGSPVSTSFNMDDALKGGTPSQAAIPPPLGEFGLNEPPPRPRRSARRGAPPNVEVPSRSQSMSTAMPPTPQTPRGPPQMRVDMNLLRRPSTGALSYTASRQPSATSATSPHPPPPVSASASAPTSAVSQQRSPLTYRGMESPRRVLTEKEKADKWEDLLERSARAGGTLHLGQAESRLMSDDSAAHEHEVREDESFFDSYYSDA